jgi:hypothetical protein
MSVASAVCVALLGTLHLLTLKRFVVLNPVAAFAAPDCGRKQRSLRDLVVPLLLLRGPNLIAAAIAALEFDVHVVLGRRRIGVVWDLLRLVSQHGSAWDFQAIGQAPSFRKLPQATPLAPFGELLFLAIVAHEN